MKKQKQLRVIVEYPEDMEAFNKRVAEVTIHVFKEMCPKEIQKEVLENAERKIKKELKMIS